MNKLNIKKYIETQTGKVPVVSSELDRADRLGAWKVRLSIGRMSYTVEPGVYAIGNPGPDSKVFVSANYKLSFDALRKELKTIDGWLLVLDTKGINVWCAAGKSTFGTEELVNRIKLTNLDKLVNHRRVIVPQLGATGVSAHEVKKLSGFSVVYGPVRASDIPAFLEAGMKATEDMRLMKFSFIDRLVLVPVELTVGIKYLVFTMAVAYILSGIKQGGYSTDAALIYGWRAVINLIMAYIAGTVAGPLLLPWIPGRSFSFKGLLTGSLFFMLAYLLKLTGNSPFEAAGWFLLYGALASFILMNFTGASTYTSISGVKKEMRIAVPMQITAVVASVVLIIVSKIV